MVEDRDEEDVNYLVAPVLTRLQSGRCNSASWHSRGCHLGCIHEHGARKAEGVACSGFSTQSRP